MSIALFFITHEGIASNLLKIGESITQKPIDNVSYHEVAMDADIDKTTKNIEDKLSELNLNKGVLFISDIYGGTPSNIAQKMADKYYGQLICGVNLPMVIRLLNYRDKSEQSLLTKALNGGRKGIRHSTSKTSH